MATDFFTHQEHARRHTTLLLLYFALAVIGLIAAVYALFAVIFLRPESGYFDPGLLLAVTGGTILVVFLGSSYKTLSLWQGGSYVALQLGGREILHETADPEERRLLNIVEEMAIASGTPVPPVYVLDHEPGINAFAAGFSPSDAVVAVNRGTLKLLNRDQLQGVIAHEFSHIFNGDMRLNLRLIGWLHGILLIFMAGRILMEFIPRGSSRSSTDDKKGTDPTIAIIALSFGLMIIGSLGLLFGRLIKAAVSRQREFLADASAVQFTRNPEGIAGALKRIGGYASGSKMLNDRSEELSHMFFSNGLGNWVQLFATHPPLDERIRRIDPNFDGVFPEVSPDLIQQIEREAAREETSQVTSGFAASPAMVPLTPESADDHVAQVDDDLIHESDTVLSQIPTTWQSLAREPFSARAVVICWLISDDPEIRAKQLAQLTEMMEPPFVALLQKLLVQLPSLPVENRIPLIDLSFPALKNLSPEQYRQFRAAVKMLIDADGSIDVFEYVLQRMLIRHLDRFFLRRPLPAVRFRDPAHITEPLTIVLGTLALASHGDDAAVSVAYSAGLSFWLQKDVSAVVPERNRLGLRHLDEALTILAQAHPELKRRILKSCAACMHKDGRVTLEEAELFRAIADALDCPISLPTASVR